MDLIGLIPAAGKGERLGLPFPKELFPVFENNSYLPVSHYSVERIRYANVRHIVFVINETKQQIIEFFQDGHEYNCEFSYVIQNLINQNVNHSSSPGLATALNSAYHLTKEKYVFFAMADTIIFPKEIFKIAWERMDKTTDVNLCLFKTNHPEKFGMVNLDSFETVIEVVDKPQKTDLEWMWGCIIWGPKFTEFLHKQVTISNYTDFASILNEAIASKLTIKTTKFENGMYLDVGTYEDVLSLYR